MIVELTGTDDPLQLYKGSTESDQNKRCLKARGEEGNNPSEKFWRNQGRNTSQLKRSTASNVTDEMA